MASDDDAGGECLMCCSDLSANPACPFCHRQGVCVTCWRTWLETHPDNPVCPVTDTNAQGGRVCNRQLTSAFIREAMGQKWYEGVWAGIRSDQLFLLEQTNLPPLQPLAAKYKELLDQRKDLSCGGSEPASSHGSDSSDSGSDSGSGSDREAKQAKVKRSLLTPAEQKMRMRSRAKIAAAAARVRECRRQVQEAKEALAEARKAEQDLRAADRLILAPPSLLCDKAMEALPQAQRERLPSLFQARYQLAGTAAARHNALQSQQPDAAAPAALINCPRDGCRGYLHAPAAAAASTSSTKGAKKNDEGGVPLRCELCKAVVCSKCQALVRDGALRGHVCDKQVLASLAAIRRDSKPCPWPECGAPTHRVSGCDQMWCVKCHRPWDWRSGRALHNPQYLHNPHYAEHMQRQRQMRRAAVGGEEEDDEGDEVEAGPRRGGGGEAACMTNGAVYAYLRQHARQWAHRLQSLTEMREHIARHGCFTETMKPDVSEAGALRDRVRYLAGELDEGAYKRSLYLRDRRCHALGATSDIVIATTLAAYDIARAWIREHRAGAATVAELGRDLSALYSRVNEDLRSNARLHGTGDYQLDPSTWTLSAAKARRSRPRPRRNDWEDEDVGEEKQDSSDRGDEEDEDVGDEEQDEDDEDEDGASDGAPAKRARTQARAPSPECDRDAPIVLYSESEDGDT